MQLRGKQVKILRGTAAVYVEFLLHATGFYLGRQEGMLIREPEDLHRMLKSKPRIIGFV